MTILACPMCRTVTAYPQTTTRAAVINSDAPNCTSYEHFTEYECIRCSHNFVELLPRRSSIPRVRSIYMDDSLYETSMNVDSYPTKEYMSSSRQYSKSIGFVQPRRLGFAGSRTHNKINRVAQNRRKKTAKLSDIKTVTCTKTVKDDCCITEINMEMEK